MFGGEQESRKYEAGMVKCQAMVSSMGCEEKLYISRLDILRYVFTKSYSASYQDPISHTDSKPTYIL